MTPQQEAKFKQAQADCFKRMKKFENGGTIPCECSLCTCPKRLQLTVTTFSTVVTPAFDIEFSCAHGALKSAHQYGAFIQ